MTFAAVSMQAIVQDRYGFWHLMTGLPYLVRLFGYGLRRPRTRVRGRDLAGRVEAVGGRVTRFRPGDEVFGICEGSFARYACAREQKLAPKPARLTFEQAAGGVGSFAVQLAKAFGAEVTGVCRTTKLDLVRSLGADHVVDYTRQDVADGGRRYDLVLDTAGNRPLSHLRRALTPTETLVLVGAEGGGRWFGGLDRQLRALLLSPFVRQRLRVLVSTERRKDLESLRELIEAGRLTPVVDRTYPLAEVPAAIRYLEAGSARGKVAITVSDATG